MNVNQIDYKPAPRGGRLTPVQMDQKMAEYACLERAAMTLSCQGHAMPPTPRRSYDRDAAMLTAMKNRMAADFNLPVAE